MTANCDKSAQAYASSPRGILEMLASLVNPRFAGLERPLQRALSHELFFDVLCDDGRKLFREHRSGRSVRRFGTPEAFHPLYVLRFAWRAQALVGPLVVAAVDRQFEGELRRILTIIFDYCRSVYPNVYFTLRRFIFRPRRGRSS